MNKKWEQIEFVTFVQKFRILYMLYKKTHNKIKTMHKDIKNFLNYISVQEITPSKLGLIYKDYNNFDILIWGDKLVALYDKFIIAVNKITDTRQLFEVLNKVTDVQSSHIFFMKKK